MNKFGRVVVCGWISTYNEDQPMAFKHLWQLVAESVTVRGFVVIDFMDRFQQGIEQLSEWLLTGRLKCREQIVDGLDNVLPTFLRLFDGSNDGKLILRLSE